MRAHFHVASDWGAFKNFDSRFFLGRTPSSGAWIFSVEHLANADYCVYVDREVVGGPYPCRSGGLPIALLWEPAEIFPDGKVWVLEGTRPQFSAVLTHDSDLLRTPRLQARLFLPGGHYTRGLETSIPRNKNRLLSISASKKRWTSGHKLRHDAVKRYASAFEIDLWGREYRPYKFASAPYRNYRFSIAIENSASDHYFTEKLLHPLIFDSVPIYWGAQKLPPSFDERGLIRFSGLEDLGEVLKTLTKEKFSSLLPYRLRNRFAALQYMEADRNLYRSLVELSLGRVPLTPG